MQRAPISGMGRRAHPAHPSNGWRYASLHNIINRSALFRPVNHTEVMRLLKGECGVQNPLLSYEGLVRGRNNALLRLMELLGSPQPYTLDLACGSELLSLDEQHTPGGGGHHEIFSTTLRYCEVCMALGYHSMLFQHWGIDRCPIHGKPLLRACTSCGLHMKPTIAACLSKPFCCTRCGHLLIKTIAASDAEEICRRIDENVGDLWLDLTLPPWVHPQARVTVTRQLLPAVCDSDPSAQRTRILQRATAWPSPRRTWWPRFREITQVMRLDFEEPLRGSTTAAHNAAVREATRMLRWLRDECRVPADQSTPLLAGSWQRIQYITPQHQDGQVSAVAVALHLTMTRYGVFPVDHRRLRVQPAWVQPYVNVHWNGVHASSTALRYGSASGVLVAMEILGYFALSVLHCAGLRPLDGRRQVSTHASFDDYSYCPFWRIDKPSRYWEMRIRPRATERMIRRLVWRYRHVSLQRLVQCSAPTGSTQPLCEGFSQVSVPLELLHFPHGEVATSTEEGLTKSNSIRSTPRGTNHWRT